MKKIIVILIVFIAIALSLYFLIDPSAKSGSESTLHSSAIKEQSAAKTTQPVSEAAVSQKNLIKDIGSVLGKNEESDLGKPAEDFEVRYDLQVDMSAEETAAEVDMSGDYDAYRVDVNVDNIKPIDMTSAAESSLGAQ